MPTDILFYLTCALLITHELDAVHKHEWRLLYVLRNLPDDVARRVFIAAHVPLLPVLFWLAGEMTGPGLGDFEVWVDGFAIVHAILHWRLTGHPKYEFHGAVSRVLIYGAAVSGAAHLALIP